MKRSGLSTPGVIVIVTVSVLALGGGVWGITGWVGGEDDNPSNLPEELTAASLAKQAEEDPGKLVETMMNTRRRDDLTEEQRRQARRNVRTLWQSQMDERVDEYFAASDEEKNAVLDRQIAETMERMESMRKIWEQRRKEREQERKESGQDDESEQDRRRRWGGSQTRDERKARSEDRDPDSSARRMAYFQAMRKRAEEQGIQMFGRGGPGGRGAGGRGGRGGGRH